MEADMQYVYGQRNNVKLCVDGFIYTQQKVLADGTVNYECQERRRGLCKAKVKVKDGNIVDRLHQHSHAPDQSKIEMIRIRGSMKRRAVDTEETPQQIITTATRGVSEHAAVQLPAMQSIRRTIRRQRVTAGVSYPVPTNLADLVIPDEYQLDSHGLQFLQFDSAEHAWRMLIFATDMGLNLLQNCREWFADGTFKVVPELFYQLYTIHALSEHHTIPCVYVLLHNKQERSYESLFRQLLALRPACQPQSLMLDFEYAALNAANTVFPGAMKKGCFYHLSQCVYRKVQDLGIQQRYQEDADFALAVGMLPALAFVPPTDVVEVFEQLQEALPAEMQQLSDYFEDNFIGRVRGRANNQQRQTPRFPIPSWNMHDRVETDLPRTNNSVEGWHRRFQTNIAAHHPVIWRFLDILRREQSLNDVVIAQMTAGRPPAPQRKKSRTTSEAITTILQNYNNRHYFDYLRGIAHNIHV